MSADLIELVENLGHPRVLVIGDVMLDRYVWGDAERISQEAPVILLHADSLSAEVVRDTLNVILKFEQDIAAIEPQVVELLHKR